MQTRYLYLILSIILTLAAVYIAATNLQPVPVAFFGQQSMLPEGALTVAAYVGGLVSGLAVLKLKSKEMKGEKIKAEWQAQDAKLANEIASDKEKQLEAKIATLEAALSKALKKNKA